MSAPLHGDWEFLWQNLFPHQFFFLSNFFHCISLAAEDHSWPPQSSWDKIFSHFSIPGLFNQPLLAWLLCCFPLHKLGDLQTSFSHFPWSWELRQCLVWQDSQPPVRPESPCVVSSAWASMAESAHVSGFLGGEEESLISFPLTSCPLKTSTSLLFSLL